MEENSTYLMQEYAGNIVRALLPINVIHSTVLVAGIIGNVFVIFIFAAKMRKYQRESRYFIPALAFYDLMVCITSGIYFLTNTFFWTSFHSDELCKTLLFFVIQTMMTSDAFLLAIAVQRYIKICRPFAKQMNLFWRRLTIAAVILANIVYSVPTAIVAGVENVTVVYKNVSLTGEGCSTGNKQYPVFQLIYYSIVMIILVANIVVTAGIYTPVACVIYRRFRKRRNSRRAGISASSVEESETSCTRETTMSFKLNTGSSMKTVSQKEKPVVTCQNSKASSNTTDGKDAARSTINKRAHSKPAKTNFNVMFFVIIFVYAVAYLPSAVMLTVVTLDGTIWARSSYDAISFYTFLIRSYVFNHAVNPFIYAYFDADVRSHITCLREFVICRFSTT